MSNLVKIKFHDHFKEALPKLEWSLSVKSVNEALHAVNILSQKKLISFLRQEKKQNRGYKICY